MFSPVPPHLLLRGNCPADHQRAAETANSPFIAGRRVLGQYGLRVPPSRLVNNCDTLIPWHRLSWATSSIPFLDTVIGARGVKFGEDCQDEQFGPLELRMNFLRFILMGRSSLPHIRDLQQCEATRCLHV